MSGDLELHHGLEEETAALKRKEAAVLFNSGYQANLGVIPALVGRGDAVYADRLSHASLVDGIALSRAKLVRFRHNDAGHLADLLDRSRSRFRRALIVTESVFSMDGDEAPLGGIVELKERHGCILMVDEAHATGVMGPSGAGAVERDGLTGRVEVVMGTFSKALGGFGAYVASSRAIADWLVNAARSFIYSTALPPAVVAADLAALRVLRREPGLGARLLERARGFREALAARGIAAPGRSRPDIRGPDLMPGTTQIVPVMAGPTARALELAEGLRARGFHVLAVRPPTVPEGTARLRFSLSLAHAEDDLRAAVEALHAIWE
jgi:8-amino-7-oxononanoate synthase